MKLIIQSFVLFFLADAVYSFHECNGIKEKEAAKPMLNCTEQSNFHKETINLIQYDFLKDECNSSNVEMFAWNEYKILLDEKTTIFSLKNYSYRPDCVNSNFGYVGNNKWIDFSNITRIITSEMLNTEIEKLSLFMKNACPDIIMNSFKDHNYDSEVVQEFLINQLGIDDIQVSSCSRNYQNYGYEMVCKYVKCKMFKPTEITRNKTIGHVCYEDIPVIIGHRTMFSKNGLSLSNHSETVDCHFETKKEEEEKNMIVQNNNEQTNHSYDNNDLNDHHDISYKIEEQDNKHINEINGSDNLFNFETFILFTTFITTCIIILVLVYLWKQVKQLKVVASKNYSVNYSDASVLISTNA
uniref:SCP domain-containing protein n=1 Tax=Rhabditophanes sp. KR3021 TaxID=114890 RepID=A0AC35TP68_9BILA